MATLFSFGDSFVAGDELATESIPNIREIVKNNVNSYNPTIAGNIDQADKSYHPVREFVKNYTEFYYKNHWNVENINREMSWTGQVASLLGAKNINMASGGASIIRIYHTLLNAMERIKNTPDSVVLVGTTAINRNSRFTDDVPIHPLPIEGVWANGVEFEHNTGISQHIDILTAPTYKLDAYSQKERDTYTILESEYNDCNLSKITYNIGIIYAIKHLLRDTPHVISDQHTSLLNKQLFQSRYVSTKNNSIMYQSELLRQGIATQLYPVAFDDYADEKANGKNYRCMFTHIMPLYHKLYANEIAQYLRKEFRL